MKKLFFLVVCGFILFSCSSSSTGGANDGGPEGGETATEWSIPRSEVFDGGPGKDGIPALENPNFVSAQNVSVLLDTDLVLGFKNGEDVRAYQHIILDWHEIINDNIGDASLAITYCPLTGTGIGWNRVINGKETTFGVSGLLYNTNLIPFDRETNSNWAQILNTAVNGSLDGKEIDLIMLVETNWKTWKTLYPNTKVVGLNTGFSRTYGISPYGDYNTNNNRFLFPVPKDNRLPSKDKIHAIISNNKAKAYQFKDFVTNHIFKDVFQENNYLLVGNENFIVSFELTTAEVALDYDYVYDGTSDVVLQDSIGNQINIFGEIVAGPDTGARLQASASFMAFWFSIPAFYETKLFSN